MFLFNVVCVFINLATPVQVKRLTEEQREAIGQLSRPAQLDPKE